jgi:hypothetical protein
MINLNVVNNYLEYKTNYFESITEFIDRYNFSNNMFISVFCCNIRSVNAHFDEFIMYIKSEKKYSNLDVIVFTEKWYTADNCN